MISQKPSSPRWKRNCIYCYGKTGTKEHVIPKAVGYMMKVEMLCGTCNNCLGGIVDNALTWDYWVQLRKGHTPPVPGRPSRYTIHTHPDGHQELMEPYTDPASWRSVAKIGFEVVAYVIRDCIFHSAFDDWRQYIRLGTPDLANKGIHRVSHYPNQWQDDFLVFVLAPVGDRATSLDIRLYNSYEFTCLFHWSWPGQWAYRMTLHIPTRTMYVHRSQGHKKPWEYLGERPT